MHVTGEPGSMVMIPCDSGDCYRGTCYNEAWRAGNGFEIGAAVREIAACVASGRELPWTPGRAGIPAVK